MHRTPTPPDCQFLTRKTSEFGAFKMNPTCKPPFTFDFSIKSSCTYFMELYISSRALYENMLSIINFFVVILNKLYYIKLNVIQYKVS